MNPPDAPQAGEPIRATFFQRLVAWCRSTAIVGVGDGLRLERTPNGSTISIASRGTVRTAPPLSIDWVPGTTNPRLRCNASVDDGESPVTFNGVPLAYATSAGTYAALPADEGFVFWQGSAATIAVSVVLVASTSAISQNGEDGVLASGDVLWWLCVNNATPTGGYSVISCVPAQPICAGSSDALVQHVCGPVNLVRHTVDSDMDEHNSINRDTDGALQILDFATEADQSMVMVRRDRDSSSKLLRDKYAPICRDTSQTGIDKIAYARPLKIGGVSPDEELSITRMSYDFEISEDTLTITPTSDEDKIKDGVIVHQEESSEQDPIEIRIPSSSDFTGDIDVYTTLEFNSEGSLLGYKTKLSFEKGLLKSSEPYENPDTIFTTTECIP